MRKVLAFTIGAVIILSAMYMGMGTVGQASEEGMSLMIFCFVDAKEYNVNDFVNMTVEVYDNGTRVSADFVNVTISNNTGGEDALTLTEDTIGSYKGNFQILDNHVIDENVIIRVNVTRGSDYATEIVIIPLGKELAVKEELSMNIMISSANGNSKGYFLPGEVANITVVTFKNETKSNVNEIEINITREGMGVQTLTENFAAVGEYYAHYTIPSNINKNETIFVTVTAKDTNSTITESDYIVVKPLIIWEHVTDRNATHASIEIGVSNANGQPVANANIDLTYYNMSGQLGSVNGITNSQGLAFFNISANANETTFFEGNATIGGIRQGFHGLVDGTIPTIIQLPGRFRVVPKDVQYAYQPGATVSRHYDALANGTPYANSTVSYYVIHRPYPNSDIAMFNGTMLESGNVTTNETGGFVITFTIPTNAKPGSWIVIQFQGGVMSDPSDTSYDLDDGLYYDKSQEDIISIVSKEVAYEFSGDIIVEVDQLRLGGNSTVSAYMSSANGNFTNAFVLWQINNTNVARLWSEISTIPTPRIPMKNNDGTFVGNITIPSYLPDTSYIVTVVLFNDLQTEFIYNYTILKVGEGTGPGLQPMRVTVIPELETVKSGNSTNVTVVVLSDNSVVDGASLNINASAGSVSETTGVTNETGRFTFVYTAPDTTMNMSVSIVVNASKNGYVNASGSVVLNITITEIIPIGIVLENNSVESNGMVNITIQTQPGASINMTTAQDIGSFMPQNGIADENGIFNTTYNAPRVETTTVVTIRATVSINAGVYTTRTAELTILPPPQLIVQITKGANAVGSGNSTYFIIQVQVSTNGELINVPDATVIASSDVGGSFSPSSGTTNESGILNITYTAPVVTQQTTATISFNASSSMYRTSIATTTIVIVPPGVSPNFLVVTLSADRTSAFGNETVTLTAYVTVDGMPVESANVTFSASEGSFTPQIAMTNESGFATTIYRTPNVASSQTIQITANASKAGITPGQGTLQITVLPGAGLEKLNVQVTAKSKTLESEQSTKITVKVTYPNGTPVLGAAITISTPSGKLTNTTGTTNANGEFTTTFKAPGVSSQKKIQVTVTATKEGYRQGSGNVTITVNPRPSPGFEVVVVIGAISIIAIAVATRRRLGT